MSSCIITGFFDIGARRHSLQQLSIAAPQPQSFLFGHYCSSLSGTMDSLGFVYIRPPTPTWNGRLRDHSVALVVRKLFAQTGSWPSLIEAVHMDVMHSSPSRHCCRITFPPAHVNAVGVVASKPYYLSANFLALPVTISQDVWDGVRRFDLTCTSDSSPVLRP